INVAILTCCVARHPLFKFIFPDSGDETCADSTRRDRVIDAPIRFFWIAAGRLKKRKHPFVAAVDNYKLVDAISNGAQSDWKNIPVIVDRQVSAEFFLHSTFKNAQPEPQSQVTRVSPAQIPTRLSSQGQSLTVFVSVVCES